MNHLFYNFAKYLPFVPTKALIRFTGQRILLPFYHVISNENPAHIKHLYPICNTSDFEKDLDFFLKYYNPISLNQFTEHCLGIKKITKPSFLLSFDDGLSEFCTVIAPILLKKGISAINFLNSDFIDNTNLFFRYKASLIIEHLISKTDSYQTIHSIVPSESLEFTISYVKQVDYSNKEILDRIAAALGIDFGAFLANKNPYLSLEQIKQLQTQGFDFGAHSVDHPKYFQIPLAEQLAQTRQSISFVASNLQIEKVPFAFPFTDFGVSKQFFEAITKDKNLLCTFGAAGIKHDTAPNNYQRLAMEASTQSAKHIVKGEYLYYCLKALLGKNKINRV